MNYKVALDYSSLCLFASCLIYAELKNCGNEEQARLNLVQTRAEALQRENDGYAFFHL